jgi:hypothetical protein
MRKYRSLWHDGVANGVLICVLSCILSGCTSTWWRSGTPRLSPNHHPDRWRLEHMVVKDDATAAARHHHKSVAFHILFVPIKKNPFVYITTSYFVGIFVWRDKRDERGGRMGSRTLYLTIIIWLAEIRESHANFYLKTCSLCKTKRDERGGRTGSRVCLVWAPISPAIFLAWPKFR